MQHSSKPQLADGTLLTGNSHHMRLLVAGMAAVPACGQGSCSALHLLQRCHSRPRMYCVRCLRVAFGHGRCQTQGRRVQRLISVRRAQGSSQPGSDCCGCCQGPQHRPHRCPRPCRACCRQVLQGLVAPQARGPGASVPKQGGQHQGSGGALHSGQISRLSACSLGQSRCRCPCPHRLRLAGCLKQTWLAAS